MIKLLDLNEISLNQPSTEICLKIFRKLIELENENARIYYENIPCYNWEPEDWDFYKQNVIKRQN